MNSSEDASIFSLISALSSAQLIEKDRLFDKESKMFQNDSIVGGQDFGILSSGTELGSTANSDKGSFGSESIDLNGGEHSVHSERVLPSFASLLSEDRRRDSNQSPAAMFGFSSSSSSSPPLSQTSEPSTGSMVNEPICTVASSTTTRSNAHSAFSFNSLRANTTKTPKPIVSDGSVFGNGNHSSSFLPSTTNPLDSAFGIFSTPLDSFSSFFDTPSTFGMTESKSAFQNHFHTSYSQDSLPQYFNQNSGSQAPNSANISNNANGNTSVKSSLFSPQNGNSLQAQNSSVFDSALPASQSGARKFLLSEGPKHTNGFVKNNSFANAFFFNEPISPKPFGPAKPSTPSNYQVDFETNVRNVQQNICSTVDFLVKGLQNKKEQLLKQLEQAQSIYLLSTSKNSGPIPAPRIQFTHADIETLKNSAQLSLTSNVFAPCCVTSGDGLSVVYEGVTASFVIHTKNCFGEDVHNGLERVKVDIRVVGGSVAQQISIQKDLVDRNNGQYEVNYLIPQGKGVSKIEILISVNGVALANSPCMVQVRSRERPRLGWQRISTYGEDGNERGKFCRPWGVALAKLPLTKNPGHKLIAADAGAYGSIRSEQIPAQSKMFYTNNFNSGPNAKDFLMAIADRSNNRVQLFKLTVKDGATEADISFIHMFGSGPGTLPGQFDRPAGVEINPNLGQCIVVDKDNHRVQVFDLSGNFLFKFGEKGSRPGQFCYPWDVAVCPQTSQILISDTRNRRIQLFSPFGQYLWHCGQPLDSPRGLAFLTPDKYVVSDFNKHRLFVIDRYDGHMHGHQHNNGHHMNKNHHSGGDSSSSWAAIAFAGAGGQNPTPTSGQLQPSNSIISQMVGGKCIGFGEGSAWGEFLRPQGLVACFHKNFSGQKHVQIFCSDSRNNRIAIWDSATQNFDYIANNAAPFDRPSGIACADNVLAVIDFGHNRVQIYQMHQPTFAQ